MLTPSPTKMPSVLDLISSLKLAFRDASFSRIENELLSREEKFKREIEEQRKEMKKQRTEIEEQRDVIEEQRKEMEKQRTEMEEQRKEIDKQRNEIENQRKETEELEEQLEFVRLDKIRIEQDLRDKCKDHEYYQKLLDKMNSRVSMAEVEIVNFKSLKASLENSEKEVKTEIHVIDHKALPRHKGNEKPPSEKTVEILDSDEDCAQSEMDVKKIPESMDNVHLDQTVSKNENGVLQRKRALDIGEENDKGDSHDRNEVSQDKSLGDRRKRMRIKELIPGLVNSPISHLSATIKSPPQGSLQKELKLTDDSDSESTSSDDSDEEIISRSLFKSIFITKAQINMDKGKWKSEAEMKAAFEKDGELCMKAVCALSRQQNSSGKNVSDSSTSEHLGFDKLCGQRGMLLSKFLTAGDPERKLKKSITDLNAYDPNGLDDCRRIAFKHVKQLFKISQQNEDGLS